MRSKQKIKKLTVKKGALIHINGLPFSLCKNTKVLGNPKNYKLAFSQSEHLLFSPNQAASTGPT